MAARIAMLGLGRMGSGIGSHLTEQGFAVTVYNRTAANAAPLTAAGAVYEPSPEAAVRDADFVLVSLADSAAVDEVLSPKVLDALAPGTLIIDLTTTSAEYARAKAAELAEAGFGRVETCVLGNPFQAKSGELRLLVSGAAEDVERAKEVLDAIGHEVRHLGPAGAASTMKLVFNALLGAQVAALAEAVSFGERAGLDGGMLLSAIAGSGFSSKVMSFRAELMRSGRYEPAAFRSVLMAKDLGLAVAAAAEAGVSVPVLAQSAARFDELVAAGYGDQDAAVLLELQRK